MSGSSRKPNNSKMPEAYREGWRDFYGLKFQVSPEVLIPRPETEQIIDMVLGLTGVPYLPGVKAAPAVVPKENLRILDVGTGSGCIAITLKKLLPEAEVTAADISEAALKVAQATSERLGVEVKFVKSDLTDKTGVDFEIIIANLPYVDKNWDWLDMEALGYEPSLALFAEDEGLELIKRLIDNVGSAQLSSERFLILEADSCQHEKIKKYALGRGLEHIKTTGFILLFAI